MAPAAPLEVDRLPHLVPLWKVLGIPTDLVAQHHATSVGVLKLSTRPANCLERCNIVSLKGLLSLSIWELYDIPAMGNTSVREIVLRVNDYFAGENRVGRLELRRWPVPWPIQRTEPLSEGTPLTLRDEWKTFSGTGQACQPLAALSLPAERFARLDLTSESSLDALLEWTWDALRANLGDDSAEELLESLVILAQEYGAARHSRDANRLPDSEAKRHLLEARWADCPIEEFGLETRTEFLLHLAGIRTLRALLDALHPLHPMLCCDAPAFEDIWNRLAAWELREGPGLEAWDRLLAESAYPVRLDDVAADIQAACRGSQWKVLCLRYGLKTETEDSSPNGNEEERVCYKLEEIAQRLDLSRERVRQIEQDAFKQLNRLDAGSCIGVVATLRQFMLDAEGILSVADAAEQLTARLPADSIHAEGLCHLLFELSDEFVPIRRGSVYCLPRVWKDDYFRIIETAVQTVKTSLVTLSEEALGQQVKERLEASGYTFTTAFIAACLRADGRFSTGFRRRDLTFLVLETLRRIGKPAHFKEITAALNASGWRSRPTGEKSVHSRLIDERDLFVYIDSGTYGLAEWGLEDRRVVGPH